MKPGWLERAAVLLLGLGCQVWAGLDPGDGLGFRSIEIHPGAGSGKPGFTLLRPEDTGVWFTNVLQGDAYLTNAVAHNGSGVALGDVDGDGRVDIYFCCLQGPNRLYRNLGNWRFEEMNLGEAACSNQFSTGATFADVDGDGDLDLLVNGIGTGTRLFLNDGKGHFTEAVNSGLSRTASATSMALADIDGDGDLDLYCTHYIDVMHLNDPTIRFAIMQRNGRWVVTKVNDQPTTLPQWKDRFEALPGGRVRELPEVDGLYRNDGQGHFTAIQFEPGVFMDAEGKPIPPYRDWGLSVMFRDMNGDGVPDLYVCNDNASPNRVWLNTGRGTFRAAPASTFRHTSRSSMGIDFADIDRDGLEDILVLDMLARAHEKRMTQISRDRPEPAECEQSQGVPRYNRNVLFMRRTDGSYAETALMAGVVATDWSWCPIFLDVDLDGYEDLLVSNGFSFDTMDQDSKDRLRMDRRMTQAQLQRSLQLRPFWPTPKAAFRNRQDGTFEPIGATWGFDQTGVSNGMAVGDLDNDGDLDVVVNNLNGVAGIYRNNASAARVAVRLNGLPPNRQGIGARVQLVGGRLTQEQEMICGGRYMSCDQAMRVFAADPDSRTPLRLEVTWRNGTQSIITNVQPNRIYEIDEAKAKPKPGRTAVRPEPFFRDVSEWLGHVHREEAFDDWARQPLLPRRLSRLGPGLSWYDFDGDGWEDLIISGGRGDSLAICLNEHGTRFRPVKGIPSAPSAQGAVLGLADRAGNAQLLVSVSNYELGSESPAEIWALGSTNVGQPVKWPAGPATLGPLALADVDGDGDLDLFVGGRFRPGRYPEPVSSALWLNEKGEFRLSQALSKPFESLGMVTGATFADLDGDGRPDLALATEWGPVRVFRNVNGQFEEMTAQWGLEGTLGWWTSIVAGDFDGDGKLDLAVGNWGRNSSYELYQPGTLGIFYGEWSGSGSVDVIEAWMRGDQWLPVRDRRALAVGLPDLTARFPTHEAYGKATVLDILGDRSQAAHLLRATHLESTVFLNRGSRFVPMPLPREAQLSPVFAISVGDLDGDGTEDLFLAQNFFGTTSDLSRDDSGLGLWLRGNGDGTFRAADATVSGIRIEGEQRGAALADFNHDGRVDLAVAQNNGPTKLYLNQGGKPGLRVVLTGPPANPQAIGAQMRVVLAGNRMGPCRAVQAGSGYWSQDGAVQVLGLADGAVGLWVRWPGGKEQTVPLEGGVRELRLKFEP